jgi:acylaminoacyl-peptidase
VVVYVQSWNDPMEDRTYSNLWKVELNGGAAQPLTTGKYHDRGARWSPDQNRIAYVSDRSGRPRIHVRDIRTGKEITLTSGESAPSNLAWSPDGTMVAYTAYQTAAAEWAPVMPAKPPGAKWAAPAVAFTNLRWTFDGTGPLPPGGVRIFVVPATGGPARQISRPPYHHTSYLTEPELTWSGDGRSILAPAVKGADGWAVYTGNQIYAFPLAGGEPEALTHDEGHKSQVRVSPDGTRIAYTGYRWKGQSYHVNALHILDRTRGTVSDATPSLDRDVASPVWSADSSRIWFLADDRGSTNLYVADTRGGVEQITKGAQRLSALAMGHDGLAGLVSSTTQPGQVVRISGANWTVLADPTREQGCHFQEAEEIWYPSFDGMKIQGWLIRPPGFEKGRKYPLVVSIHGGPHGAYGASFVHDLQVLAAHGYVVLYTNPRGSTGYGESFGNIIQHKWPGDDIRDVMAGVDYVLQSGDVDESRMAVTGGSGGGLMTSWMVTQTARFRAAVALYPVTNWFTHVGSGDNGFYIASVYRKGMPWDEPEDYMRHSPLFYANRVKTPTMIITGEEDWRTPIAQSYEFYRALKVRGIDTVLVRVPDEPHGLRNRPSHRLEATMHTLAWLDRYLSSRARSAR